MQDFVTKEKRWRWYFYLFPRGDFCYKGWPKSLFLEPDLVGDQ